MLLSQQNLEAGLVNTKIIGSVLRAPCILKTLCAMVRILGKISVYLGLTFPKAGWDIHLRSFTSVSIVEPRRHEPPT